MANSNAYMAQYMADRRANRRELLIEMLGGACVRCGGTERLELDHIEPGTQAFRLSGKHLDQAWGKVLTEASKCQILCQRCHHQKSQECGELGSGPGHNRIDDHGTEAMYGKGCRCEPCREARHDARIARGEFKGTRGRYKRA